MLRTTLKSINAHKLRLVATSLAIVVGVAFVTGTLILSDTLTGTFENLFVTTTDGVDVAIQGPEDTADPFTGLRDPIPTEVADVIAGIDGVAAVAPEVQGAAQLIDADGEPVGGAGPPTLAYNAPLVEELDTATLREGRYPTAADEIAIDVATAEANDFAIGDTIGVVTEGPVVEHRLVGLVGFGDLDNLAGATLVLFEPETAFAMFGGGGYTSIQVAAEDGVNPSALRDDIAAAIDPDLDVQTGDQLAASLSEQVTEGLGFFTTGLLVFAGVALFVGAFLIANTFSIILAQRTRELALLRAVGASRRQILTSVLGEALATGLLGAVIGFGLGVALAQGLYALLDVFGVSLPSGNLVVEPATAITALLLGVILTVAVAVVPAARSTRVPPVAALQAVAAPPPPRHGVLRYALGGLVFVAGVGGLLWSITADQGIQAVGAFAVATLIGAAFLAPLVATPLLKVLGTPLSAARGMPGALATENALRNPRRTAATASALMIGLALVSFVVILAGSFSASAQAAIEESFNGDFQIASQNFFGAGAGPGQEFEAEVEAVDGVASAITQQVGLGELDGAEQFFVVLPAEEVQDALTLTVVDGGEDGILAGGLALSESTADAEGLAVGDAVTVAFGSQSVEVVVGSIFQDNPLAGGPVLAAEVVPETERVTFASLVVNLADGVDPAAARVDVEEVLEAYPTVVLQDLTDIKDQLAGQINQIVGLMSALLGLSVIVALFGIVNTLGLSVFERTRELGLLRAVGATRSQVRSMIRWESVLIALLGAVFGLLIGVLFAWLVVIGLGDETDLLRLSIPIAPLAGGLVGAAVAGVLAAVVPAFRGARIDVLRALEAT